MRTQIFRDNIMRKHFPNVIGLLLTVVTGFGLYIWSVWQHDVLAAPRIADFYDGIFEFFTGIRTSVGFAYNVTLLLQTIGVAILAVGIFLGVWFWEDEPKPAS